MLAGQVFWSKADFSCPWGDFAPLTAISSPFDGAKPLRFSFLARSLHVSSSLGSGRTLPF